MTKNRSWHWLASVLVLLFLVCLMITLRHSRTRVSPKTADASVPVNVPDEFVPIPRTNPVDDKSPQMVSARQATSGASPEAMRRLAAGMSRATGDLQITSHSDGRRSVNLGGRFMHVSAIITGTDGKTEIRCFSDYQKLEKALNGASTPDAPSPISDDR